jgi:heme O synthase-like polyprenyltransferase
VLIVLRIVGLAVAAVLGVCVLAWALTGERKWLRVAWVVFKYAVYALALILALFAGEALLRG